MIIEDDFAAVRQKLVAADGIVFATPVYFWDITESARTFLDRLRRTHYPIRDTSPLTGKPAVAIAAAGGNGNGSAEAAARLDEYLFRWMDMKRVLALPVTRDNARLSLKTAGEAGELLVEMARSG